ncbi:hypothetical protein SS1G_02764 [Sclerotinia sclerotiorum 1980 UF-70]|uniref:Uncharacterized protein n=1 Tax=Sclerotinia sclerotiorum (strain ATCC 18683 / 1980 / Ss-1) TaxID=665079 RepID=A7EBS8_SCLS1|nr:hypothetical protein SS1G_02764 [Sclerotinia sclerotiorum 1980 UF-70]EDN99906.1 hypothetical protein SS1G_02764 [Sclerotinia sclerotiorum 1980 UF-70]
MYRVLFVEQKLFEFALHQLENIDRPPKHNIVSLAYTPQYQMAEANGSNEEFWISFLESINPFVAYRWNFCQGVARNPVITLGHVCKSRVLRASDWLYPSSEACSVEVHGDRSLGVFRSNSHWMRYNR